jgi:hypothetical protein
VHHADVRGKRDRKYDRLTAQTLDAIAWTEVNYNAPNYFFVPRDETGRKKYDGFISIPDLFPNNKTGIVTMGDSFAIDRDKDILKNRLLDFKNTDYSESQLKEKFDLGKNYAKRIVDNKVKITIDENKFVSISYRPFDIQWTYYDNNILRRWRNETMQHFVKGENIGLVSARQCADDWKYIFVSKNI